MENALRTGVLGSVCASGRWPALFLVRALSQTPVSDLSWPPLRDLSHPLSVTCHGPLSVAMAQNPYFDLATYARCFPTTASPCQSRHAALGCRIETNGRRPF